MKFNQGNSNTGSLTDLLPAMLKEGEKIWEPRLLLDLMTQLPVLSLLLHSRFLQVRDGDLFLYQPLRDGIPMDSIVNEQHWPSLIYMQ